MKKTSCIIIAFFATITLSCNHEKSQIDRVFSDINSKYSSIIKLGEDKKLTSIFTKRVTYKTEDYKLEIQIWKANAEYYEPNYVVLLKRNENQLAGIPLFSNSYTDYWAFNNETNNSIKDSKKTFEYEYNDMLKKLQLDSMRSSSAEPIYFLNYFFNSIYLHGDNIATLHADTSIGWDGKISKKELERKELMTKNFIQIEQLLHRDSIQTVGPPLYGIYDMKNDRIMIPIFKYDENLKKGKFVFKFFRYIHCGDPIPEINI
jgi:hypothetical protein